MDVSIYHLKTRDILTLCVMALLLLGIVMVQSASVSVSGTVGWAWSDKGVKHAMFAAASLLTFFAVGMIDYGALLRGKSSVRAQARSSDDLGSQTDLLARIGWIIRNPIFLLFAVAVIVNLAVLIPHVGVTINGARRWLRLGPIQLQPSEVAKWAVVLFLAYWLTYQPVNMNRFFTGFLVTLIPVGIICLLVVIQDFGTATLIATCALAMLMAGKVRWRHLLITIPPVLLAALWFMMHKEYRWKRVTAFANPYAAPQKEGYHMIQSLLSFSTGGVTGRGLGNGIQKLGYLPEDTTDFIFSVICEELGLFGALLTIALYLGIIFAAWQVLKEKKDTFGKMLAFGISAMVGLQAIINIAVSTVSVPTKGLSLPLVSAGGTGLIITCAALGLLRSVCQFQHAAEDLPETENNGDDSQHGGRKKNDSGKVPAQEISSQKTPSQKIPPQKFPKPKFNIPPAMAKIFRRKPRTVGETLWRQFTTS
jgi:cell division protein FtsW